jgi:hypothetical protein
VKELARLPRLGDRVKKVEACHLFVRDLRVDTDHLRVIERRDETEIAPVVAM